MIPQTFKTISDIKRLRQIQNRNGIFVPVKKMVDICIPSYKEEGYIERTLNYLMNQTLWSDNLMNIVVGEYSHNPEHLEGKKKSYLKEICEKNQIIHVYVPVIGAGNARNHTILYGSISDIITNFDADSRFNRHDAIDILTRPILEKKAIATYCELNFVKEDKKREKNLDEKIFSMLAYNSMNFMKRVLPTGSVVGLSFSREAFFRVNGFPLTKYSEDHIMHYRLSHAYGMFSRHYIQGVKVLTSDRRIVAISKYGLGSAMDYNKNYR